MKKISLLAAGLLLGVVTSAAAADEKKPEKNWSDELELSYVNTTGNSRVSTFSGKNLFKYKFTPAFSLTWKLAALSGSDKGTTNAEMYATDLRLDYLFTERFYSYANAGWLKDRFAGFDPRLYIGTGVGYKILTGPVHTWVGEVGLNFVHEEYTDTRTNDFIGGRLFTEYGYAFTEKSKFTQSLEFLDDLMTTANYQFISVSALTGNLTNIFSLKLSYTLRYWNRPPTDKTTTDTILAAALMASF